MTFISKFISSHFEAILFITLLSFIFPGYKVLTTDQIIYLPQIVNIGIPELANNDLLYYFNQIDMTIFDEVLLLVKNTLQVDLFTTIFVWTVITRFIYFVSIYYISLYFTNNKIFSLLSPLLFLTGSIVYGTLTLTMEQGLHPRIISLSLSLLFLALHLHKRFFIAVTILGIAFLIHPLTSIPFLVFLYTDIFLLPFKDILKNVRKNIVLGIIPLIFLAIALAIFNFQSDSSIFVQLDTTWRNIVQFRDGYIFLVSWDFLGSVHFISSAVFLSVIFVELKRLLVKDKKRYFYLLLGIPLVLSVLFFILSDLNNVLISLQLYRSLIFWKIILTILFAYFVFKRVQEFRTEYFYNFVMLGVIFSIIIQEYILFVFLPVFIVIWLKKRLFNLEIKNIPEVVKSLIVFLNKKSVLYFLLFTFSIAFIFISTKINYSDWLEYPIYVYFSAIMLISLIASKFHYFIKGKFLEVINFKVTSISFIIIIIGIILTTNIKPALASQDSFNELCTFLKTNTSASSVLLTEPFSNDSAEIRFYCQRSIFYTYKDGAQVAFDKRYAVEWYRRFQIISSIENKSTLSRIPYENIDFIISERPLEYNQIRLVFQNEKYSVYSVN